MVPLPRPSLFPSCAARAGPPGHGCRRDGAGPAGFGGILPHAAKRYAYHRTDGASEDKDEQALEACAIAVSEHDQGRMGEYAVLFSDASKLLVGAAVKQGKAKLEALTRVCEGMHLQAQTRQPPTQRAPRPVRSY